MHLFLLLPRDSLEPVFAAVHVGHVGGFCKVLQMARVAVSSHNFVKQALLFTRLDFDF